MKKLQLLSLLIASNLLLGAVSLPAQAADFRDYLGYGHPYRTDSGRFFYQHPYVQKAVLLGGAGAAVGAIAGGEGNRVGGATKGALLGAGLGMGYEYLRERNSYGW